MDVYVLVYLYIVLFCKIAIISYPYWLVAEWMAPYAEALGLLFVIVMACFGLSNWPFFFSLILLVYCFAIAISVFAIFMQELTFHKYESVSDILKLVQTAMLEPILYHPRTVYWSMKGNYDHFMGTNKGWGEMTRKGFAKTEE